jgi:hypothetical protein
VFFLDVSHPADKFKKKLKILCDITAYEAHFRKDLLSRFPDACDMHLGEEFISTECITLNSHRGVRFFQTANHHRWTDAAGRCVLGLKGVDPLNIWIGKNTNFSLHLPNPS